MAYRFTFITVFFIWFTTDVMTEHIYGYYSARYDLDISLIFPPSKTRAAGYLPRSLGILMNSMSGFMIAIGISRFIRKIYSQGSLQFEM